MRPSQSTHRKRPHLVIYLLAGLASLGLLVGLFNRESAATPGVAQAASVATPPSPLATLPTTAAATLAPSPISNPTQEKALDELCQALYSTEKDPLRAQAQRTRAKQEFEKTQREVAQLLAGATTSADPKEKAAALFLQQAFTHTWWAPSESPICDSNKETCTEVIEEARRAASQPDRDALATLAVHSNDPQIYALAYQACHPGGKPVMGFCAQINAAQWHQRDPSSGSALVAAAREAKEAGQTAALDEAIFQLSQAQYFDQGHALLALLVDKAATQGESPLTYSSVSGLIYGTLAPQPPTDYSPLVSRCKGAAPSDPNLHQLCDSVASTLLQHETSIWSRSVGYWMGEGLGWTPENLAAAQDEVDAMWAMNLQRVQSLQTSSSDIPAQLQSCRRSNQFAQYFSATLRMGEANQIQAQIAAQPKSPRALAQEFRARRQAEEEKNRAAVTEKESVPLKP